MEFERQQKINRILLQSLRAYEEFKDPYMKVPVELAQFAVRERRISEASSYLAGLFLWSGKVKSECRPSKDIATICTPSERTVYRSLDWLSDRDWIVKNPSNGWIYFRGLNQVHEIEGWKYSRCAVMRQSDLVRAKEFYIGAVLSSIVQTGEGTGTDRKRRRSETTRFPVSLSMIQKVFDVSQKTAFTYRKIAKNAKYIKSEPNVVRVQGLSAKDVRLMKQNHIESVDIGVFGSSNSISVHPNQLFSDKGIVKAQLANWIYPQVQIKKRKLNPQLLRSLC